MKTWFTSDLHFYHTNVIAYCNRPFTSVEEMNEMLVKNWNETVGPDDLVYVLGDFSLAIRPVELFTKRLNGRKILVSGNHDWCHPANKKARGDRMAGMVAKYIENGFEAVYQHMVIHVDGEEINLSHMPYREDDTDQRFFNHRLINNGNWLFCGHVHEKWQRKGNMINVGVDVWNMRPVALETLMEIISRGVNG